MRSHDGNGASRSVGFHSAVPARGPEPLILEPESAGSALPSAARSRGETSRPGESSRSADDDRGDDGEARPTSLEEVLDLVERQAEGEEEMTLGDLVDAVGRRTFSPIIVLAGLVMLAPGVGDIPGVPVLMGLVVILVSVQMLMNRESPWLPGWLTRRSVRASRVTKMVGWLRRPAHWVDRWLRERLTWAVRQAGFVTVAVACILVSAMTPLMEVVPFSAALAGVVITAFGVALIARDGLVALLSMGLAVGTGVFLCFQLG